MAGRVALLFHEGYGGGASISTIRVLPLMIERGWEPVAYVDYPGRLAGMLEDVGVRVEGRPRQVSFSLKWLRHPPGPRARAQMMGSWFVGLGGWLRRTRPDLVHANSLYSLPDALLARGLRLPVYLQLLEMLPGNRKGELARRAIWTSGIRPGTVSQASAARFAGGGRMPEIVYSGTPWPEQPAERPAVPERPVVGTIGWICPRKGSDVFVDMARIVREQRPDVEFRMVGDIGDHPDAPWGNELMAKAADLGIVHIPETNVFREMRDWDLMVLPSRFDPYPLSVLEAMAMAVPVVGSDVDGIVEQVVEGTGALARTEDPEDFARHVTALLEDGDRRRRMAERAREHARENFTLERQAEGLDRAWRATIDRSGARSRAR